MTLPQRIFRNPLARALVEQRRNLILDPDHAPKQVEMALSGLTIAPELFDTPANIYLGLKQAKTSLEHARSDADLLDVAALLWAMAQQLENGDASKAERDLRAAEQALREALQRGASDEEIKKLMQQLREAANRFMSEMARNSPPDSNPEDQNLQAQDLDKLIDQMEDTARNGSREDAQAMLDQMQEMFENMRSAQDEPGKPGRTRDAQADRRTREAPSRPAGFARRHLPQRPEGSRAQTGAAQSIVAGPAGLAGATGPGWFEPSRPERQRFRPGGQPGPGPGG